MKLYHGSPKKSSKLKRQQACGPPGTPREENLNMIYFTPDFAFALICAAGPRDSINTISHNERTAHFQKPDKFNPEQTVYIYIVDSAKIPPDKQKPAKNQVIVDLDEIEPDEVQIHKASEIYQYYKIT